jgi:hypothetical protein
MDERKAKMEAKLAKHIQERDELTVQLIAPLQRLSYLSGVIATLREELEPPKQEPLPPIEGK